MTMKHFCMDEFFNSAAAQASGINNVPAPCMQRYVCDNINRLVDHVLDPIGDHVGLPIIISNGYCCPELNDLIGERLSGRHLIGQAVDFTIPDMSPSDLKKLAYWCADNLDFDQLIVYPRHRYIHVSYVSPEDNKHEVLYS